ncbi:hypothetical protein SE92_07975 [Bradyrhizobium sp. AT1]|uniref:hypothetical protein n=1 Tax=Bradyrhizobium sp. AT1 TaxID=574934 RepID=UPI00079B5CE0|nr:hypothetical protein [Bradyrhizobium sp. AT1]KYG20207.1 hypothetical protein SE92_07975 [Bradyrhizobium sp. AT1]
MIEVLNNLAAVLGYAVLALTAVSGTVWWIFKTFSERWLNAKFAERLETLKHEQQKELAELKFAIDAQMDRATKLHQQEFETLPKAWRLLVNSFGIAREVTSRMQSTPDLNSMSDVQREDFLVEGVIGKELAEWQRQKIRDATDKTAELRNQWEPFKIARAKRASAKFYKYFRANGIFIRESLKTKFDNLDQMVLAAISAHQMNFQHRTRELKAIDRLADDGEAMIKALEIEVQKRLWDSTATGTESNDSGENSTSQR